MLNFRGLKSFGKSGQVFRIIRKAHTAAREKIESAIEILTKQDAKVSQSSAGITVASVENYSPVSQVSVVVKAGAVYETPQNLGVVHCIRNAAVLSTKNHTSFGITRNLEVKGSKLNVASTREHIVYTLQCVRDEIDSGLELLAEVSTNNHFKSWEIKDMKDKMELDLALLNTNTEAVLLEALHKAAFRGGLSHSLYSPSFMVGQHTSEMLEDFVANHFSASRTSVVGLGVCNDHLQSSVNKLFELSNTSAPKVTSKFGGGEIRIEADLPHVHMAVVSEGASHQSLKDTLSLNLLQCLLGPSYSSSKMGHSHSSKLGEAASKVTSNAFAVSSLNVQYSDTGLFGVYVQGAPEDIKALITAVMVQMRDTCKSISENDLQIAKHKLKAKLHLDRENSKDLLSIMTVETANFGSIRNITEMEKMIDDLKASDVTSVAGKMMKAKLASASLGRLHATPHLDELV